MSEGLATRGEFDAVVIRTDYTDERAWRALAATLPPHVHVVDDPSWSGATVDRVLTATRDAEDLSVVFLADTTTTHSRPPALLAVTTLTREDCEDAEDHARLTESGPTFRTTPAGVPDIHANLSLGNLGFEEYAAWAGESPDGVYRSA
ncbi:hypothetical protein EV284_1308 [Streptomyces sp. BK022]|uniref:DUF6924 domain-containing protein n=1 Tax=Streptomyces sp. BK022 TaxID=2512123 RepID=UPI00102A14FA|nr:hypothetical protein [Streptomyces sp. BK022]RZU43857.1 hypothetical protein EV284_1308 [Streptomyces sp. BK022]